MSVLKNQRYELFAQGLAKGLSQDAAYEAAGFKPSRSNASRLSTNENVIARVTELKERAAARTEITVAGITERLLNIAAKGERSNDAPLLSVARASLMDAAKLNGLVIDKGQLSGPDGGAIPIGVKVEFVEPEGGE